MESGGFPKYKFRFRKPKKIDDFTLGIQETVNELNKKGLDCDVIKDGRIFYYDDDFFVLYDAFPKSFYHLLVIPRIEISKFDDLRVEHILMIKKKVTLAEKIIRYLKEESEKLKIENLRFQYGFHAVPSLKQVHMHVMSMDFSTHFLKKDIHWNSFTTGFFIHPDIFIQMLEKDERIGFDHEVYSKMKNSKILKCPKTNRVFQNVKRVKAHWINVNRWDNPIFKECEESSSHRKKRRRRKK